jgi:hypothetical protein
VKQLLGLLAVAALAAYALCWALICFVDLWLGFGTVRIPSIYSFDAFNFIASGIWATIVAAAIAYGGYFAWRRANH